ncbi:MAG: TIGR03619 family F420-dependent LLM class oxidoreductase [Chloroflexi bacterium]|nr:TIGR03619 family F420-dependent LLM class oxidoreductase [Chloroflexota bacterium]
MLTHPRVVLNLQTFPPTEIHRMMELARYAEAQGIDDVSLSEHVVMSVDQSLNPSPVHNFEEAFPEPLVTFGAVAATTERMRLITSILISPLRPAALLAKQVATVHALSHGRFVLGVSVSWDPNEYAALGVPFHQRGQVLDDQIAACQALWRHGPVSFSSATVNFRDVACVPRPGAHEHVPIWFGGEFGPRLVRRVGTMGHGWILTPALGETVETLRPKITQLREALEGNDRDPAILEVAAMPVRRAPTLGETLKCLPEMLEAGVNCFRFGTAGLPTVEAMKDYVQELAEAFRPYR